MSGLDPYAYEDTSCFEEEDCRVIGCNSKVSFGRADALADLGNVDWCDFTTPIDLLSLNVSKTADVETYRAIGSCADRCKVTGRHWSVSGDLYYCEQDIASCYLQLEGNCVSICIIPCGQGFSYDTDGTVDDEFGAQPCVSPVSPDGSVLTGVMLGVGVINSCEMSITPDDYITTSFSITGCDQLYRWGYCDDLVSTGTPDLGPVPPLAP